MAKGRYGSQTIIVLLMVFLESTLECGSRKLDYAMLRWKTWLGEAFRCLVSIERSSNSILL